MKLIRTGIVGFGAMAEKHHLPKMRETGLFEMVSVCDITPSRRALAETMGLKATADLDAFLASDIELVVIATHSSTHHELALKAAAAGRHMLIEKPLAVSGKQAEEMTAAAGKAGVVMMTYHNRHFDPDYRMVKSAVRDGLLGDIVSIENRTFGARPAVGFGVKDYNQEWRITAAHGGGTLLDFGPHWTEQILDLMEGQSVIQVFGDVRHVRWGDADDHFRIDMVFSNGVRAAAAKSDIAYGVPPLKWIILGDRATLRGPQEDRIVISGPDYELRRATAVEETSLHANLARHIRNGEPLVITPQHALRVMRVLQAAIDSAGAGRSVEVNI